MCVCSREGEGRLKIWQKRLFFSCSIANVRGCGASLSMFYCNVSEAGQIVSHGWGWESFGLTDRSAG